MKEKEKQKRRKENPDSVPHNNMNSQISFSTDSHKQEKIVFLSTKQGFNVFPKSDVFLGDDLLIEVSNHTHGFSYFAYWDESGFQNQRYTQQIKCLKDEFLKGKNVFRGMHSQGIKKLSPPILGSNKIEYTHEIKTYGYPDRALGFFIKTNFAGQKKYVVIFCYFDQDGKMTKHS